MTYYSFDFRYRFLLDEIVAEWTGKSQVHTNMRDYADFAEYIGFPNFDYKRNIIIKGGMIVDIDNPKIQHILELAKGPHTKTILKMVHLRAQR